MPMVAGKGSQTFTTGLNWEIIQILQTYLLYWDLTDLLSTCKSMRKLVTQVFYGIKLTVIPSHLRQSQFRYVTTLESPEVNDIFPYGNLRASNIRGLIGGQLHIPARSNLHTLALFKNPELKSLSIECPLVKLKLSKPVLIEHAPQTLTHLKIRFCKTANLHLIPPTITNLRINFDLTRFVDGALPPSVKKLTLSGRLKSWIGLANVECLKLTSDFELDYNVGFLNMNNLKTFINQTLYNREYLLHFSTAIQTIALKWGFKAYALTCLNLNPYKLVILKGGDSDARYPPTNFQLSKNVKSLQLDTVWRYPVPHHVESISVLKKRGEYKTFTRGFWTRSLLWFLEFCFFYKWAYWTFFDHHK